MKSNLILGLALAAMLPMTKAPAEEGASGHYIPGLTATCYDAMPDKPGFAAFNFFTIYSGNAGAGKPLDFSSDVALGVKANFYANTVGTVYQSDLKLLGGNYGAVLAIPFVWVDVHAQTEITGPKGGTLAKKNVSDSASGLGDMTIYPFIVSWKALNDELKYDIRTGIYAPTGSYDVGRLANCGKNYWTFEPGASASWLSKKFGTEISLFTGFDFNTENPDTHYQTGTQYHLDLSVVQHLPLWGGFAGVGANGFYYQQIEGDSGSGANLGNFEGQTIGVGPAISYVHPLGTSQIFGEVKWLPEVEVKNRTEGDYIWIKAGVLF
jgi:hypothetical protein